MRRENQVTKGRCKQAWVQECKPYMRDSLKIDHPRDRPRAAARPGPYCLASLNQPPVWTCREMQLLEGKSGQSLIRAISTRRLIHSHATPSRACMLFCSKDWLPRPLGQPPLQDSAPRPACQALGSRLEMWESSCQTRVNSSGADVASRECC